MIRYTIAIIIGFLTHTTLKAQTLKDPLYVNYSFIPSHIPQKGIRQFNLNYFEANIPVPIKLSENVKLINAVYYRYTNFDFNSDIGSDIETNRFSNNFHDLRYSAILKATITDRLEIISIARVMLRSDLQENLSGRDFFPFGLAMANYAIGGNPDFTIGFGIALVNDFNYNTVLPLAALNYESEKIKLEIVYPNINFLYKKSKSFEFGLFANVDGNISRVSQQNLELNDPDVHFQRNIQILVAPTVSHRIYNQIFGHLKIGVAPFTRLQFLDDNYEILEKYNESFDPALFMRAGISYRLPKKEK